MLNNNYKQIKHVKQEDKVLKMYFYTILVVLAIVSHLKVIQSLQNVPGKVGAGNYTYFQLNFEGALLLELETLEGDADLYVSEKVQRPTFDLEEHSLSSWTCGLDAVFIPKTMTRPIYIGVYGHPRYEQSTYLMSADVLPQSVDDLDGYMDLEDDERQKATFKYKNEDESYRKETPEVHKALTHCIPESGYGVG